MSTKEEASVSKQSKEAYLFPLSFAQQRLWFLDQFEPQSPVYNIPAVYRMKGRLDTDAFTRSINTIERRH